MRTVVVTGAAGSLGRRVADRLAAEPGTRVVGIDAVADHFPPVGVESRVMDLAAPGEAGEAVRRELGALLAGADTVVHAAWQSGDDLPGGGGAAGARPAPDANLAALSRVLEASAGVRSLVLLSSATVYGAWADNRVPLTEDVALRPNPDFAFALSKAEAERVVAGWAGANPGTAVSVLRPTVTVGGPERPLYLALGGTRVPGADDGARPVQFLHVDDLASAVILAAEKELRGVFNVAPDAGIGEGAARSLAGGVARITLPARVARPLVALGWDLWRRGVPREARPYTIHPWVVAPDRLKAAGWEPQFTSEEALVATDERPHFDDLPPRRRQVLTMAAGAAALVAGAAGVAGGVVVFRARRRPRPLRARLRWRHWL